MAMAETYPRTAYLLALIGGILILFLSIIEAIVLAVLATFLSAVGFGVFGAFAIAIAVVAILLGVIVLVFAMRLKSRPADVRMTGVVILVLAIVNLAIGGGFYIGSILALIGGILAIIWKPPAMSQPAWGAQPTPPTMAPNPPGWAGQPPSPPPSG